MTTSSVASAILLAFVALAGANFIGPAGPRIGTGSGTSTAPSGEPPIVGDGLTPEEVRVMLKNRHALVIAGEDVVTALEVAEGLVEVGASVVLGCRHPELAREAAEQMVWSAARSDQEPTAGNSAASVVEQTADDDAGAACWKPGCEVRELDLTSPMDVYGFADAMLAEDRPLHVIVNCADDVERSYRREGDWEQTFGRNHLGPFLLTQLLLDKVVATMRLDAATTRAAARRGDIVRAGGGASASTGDQQQQRQQSDTDGELSSKDAAQPLQPRPYPAPFGRVVSLGLPARFGKSAAADPPAVEGLFLKPSNYTGWRAYRCSHEANTLAAVQLSRMLSAVKTVCGESVEVNVVRPPRARWLPRPMRKLFGASQPSALTATFLASTPIKGLSGLFFDDFASEAPWRKTAKAPGETQGGAARQLYAASMAMIGSPTAEWRTEATMKMRGYAARQRRRPAVVRGRRAAGSVATGVPDDAPDASYGFGDGAAGVPQELDPQALLNMAAGNS